MTATHTLPHRSEVPTAETWNLASIYATPADWEAACRDLAGRLPALAVYAGKLGDSPATLATYLAQFQDASILMGKIFTYASNGAAVDTGDQAAAARAGQARSLMARLGAAAAFLDPELLAIGFPRLEQWLAETPELAWFSHYVDKLRRRQAHVRTGEVEQALALVTDPFSGPMAAYTALNNADLTFRPATASDGAADGGGPGLDGRAAHARRSQRAPHRLGELRRTRTSASRTRWPRSSPPRSSRMSSTCGPGATARRSKPRLLPTTSRSRCSTT